MSAVSHALSNLSQAIGSLEGAVYRLETSVSGQQRDMFSAGHANANGGVAPDVAVEKLGVAIQSIESVLEEDRAHG
ncbi:MAG: hypothetical protein KDI46_09735 [Alphaproteobacteria bacterium]|nr:hypothetical protein [Alphaproteobacteria bacterium]